MPGIGRRLPTGSSPLYQALSSARRAEREAAVVVETPMRRFGEAKEVVTLAVLLASDEAT